MVKTSDILDSMIHDAELQLNSLRDEIAVEVRYLADLRKRRSASHPQADSKPQNNGKVTIRHVAEKSLTDHIVQIFRAEGRNLRAKEIVERLDKMGITTTAKRGMLPNVNSSLFRRKDLFKKRDRGLYGLKK